MKYKYIIIVFVLGLMLDIIGALFKIIHFEIGPFTGNVFLTIGAFIKLISIIMLLIKLFTNKDKQNFLNQ